MFQSAVDKSCKMYFPQIGVSLLLYHNVYLFTLTCWKSLSSSRVEEWRPGFWLGRPPQATARLSQNCRAKSEDSFVSPRYKRTYSATSLGGSMSLKKLIKVETKTEHKKKKKNIKTELNCPLWEGMYKVT